MFRGVILFPLLDLVAISLLGKAELECQRTAVFLLYQATHSKVSELRYRVWNTCSGDHTNC